MHHNTIRIQITNKVQLFTRIHYSNVSLLLNMFRATHRSSSGAQTLIAVSGFTYVCGCRPLSWQSGNSGLPPGKDPVPIVQEAGWAPGPVWTGAENLASHRDSIPGPSSPYPVAIPTEPPGPLCTLYCVFYYL